MYVYVTVCAEGGRRWQAFDSFGFGFKRCDADNKQYARHKYGNGYLSLAVKQWHLQTFWIISLGAFNEGLLHRLPL